MEALKTELKDRFAKSKQKRRRKQKKDKFTVADQLVLIINKTRDMTFYKDHGRLTVHELDLIRFRLSHSNLCSAFINRIDDLQHLTPLLLLEGAAASFTPLRNSEENKNWQSTNSVKLCKLMSAGVALFDQSSWNAKDLHLSLHYTLHNGGCVEETVRIALKSLYEDQFNKLNQCSSSAAKRGIFSPVFPAICSVIIKELTEHVQFTFKMNTDVDLKQVNLMHPQSNKRIQQVSAYIGVRAQDDDSDAIEDVIVLRNFPNIHAAYHGGDELSCRFDASHVSECTLNLRIGSFSISLGVYHLEFVRNF